MSQPTKDTKYRDGPAQDQPPPALSLTISGPTEILRRVIVAGDDRMLGQQVKKLALDELVRREVAEELAKDEHKQFP